MCFFKALLRELTSQSVRRPVVVVRMSSSQLFTIQISNGELMRGSPAALGGPQICFTAAAAFKLPRPRKTYVFHSRKKRKWAEMVVFFGLS